MATTELARAQQHLRDTIKAFNEALKKCTPEELMGAKAITEVLVDARLRMEILENRIRERIGIHGP